MCFLQFFCFFILFFGRFQVSLNITTAIYIHIYTNCEPLVNNWKRFWNPPSHAPSPVPKWMQGQAHHPQFSEWLLPLVFQGEPGKSGEKGLGGAPGLRVSYRSINVFKWAAELTQLRQICVIYKMYISWLQSGWIIQQEEKADCNNGWIYYFDLFQNDSFIWINNSCILPLFRRHQFFMLRFSRGLLKSL